ncbi:hypothetical protein MHB_0000660 [Pseudomonas fluorescens BBc6R8]|uniref:hypothetical protein n=1 Tax=Pseudomonas fluorescens TaxID=294 RepID=UPI0003CCD58F|nr:hypothetical protein [Pseudomonas fluorescens]QQD54814.1 hypothetical protein MHB_0000660 [Pseudomonas fluorescens BBc6R8]
MTDASQVKQTLTTHGRGSKTHIPDYAPILFNLPKIATIKPKDILLYGMGVNDFAVTPAADDWSFNVWDRILDCCYNDNSTRSRATYFDCSVAECWHRYSDFKVWFDKNCIIGYQLDKDILVPGNRVYGPDTCCFVPKYINDAVRWWRKKPRSGYSGIAAFGSGFQAEITHKGFKQIGEWRTSAMEAHCDWQRMKAETIEDHLCDYLREVAPDLRVVRALVKYVDRLRSNADAMVPTFQYQH